MVGGDVASAGWPQRTEVVPVDMEAMGQPKMTWTLWGNGEFPVAKDNKAEVFEDVGEEIKSE